MKPLLALAALLLVLAPASWGTPSVQQVIDYLDANYQIRSDMTAQARITARDPEQGTKVIDCVLYRRSTRTFTHIGRDEKIAGSNASAGDIETRKFRELYKPAQDASGKDILSEETIGGAKIPVYRLEVTAKVNDVKYPRLVMWVTRDKYLELKRESYSLSGTLMETDLFTNYKEVEGRYVPLLQKFTDEVEKGRNSLLEITGISFDQVPDYKFDKSYLESLSK